MTLATPPSKHPALAANPGVRVMRLSDGVCLEAPDLGAGGAASQDVWIDLESPSAQQIAALDTIFKFNAFALEDALEHGHGAKFEVYPEHVFLVFRTLAEPEDVSDRSERVSFFWFPERNTVLTLRNEPVTYLQQVWLELRNKPNRKPLDVVYTLLSKGTDTFFTFLDEMENSTDELEESVLDGGPGIAARLFVKNIFELKHTLIQARRLVSGARETVAQFSRHAAMLEPQSAIYLRDVTDHLTRVYEGVDSSRDVLSSLLDVHLSVQSNRMNEVMKTLTALSAIFLPLTFFAGVWGMNFSHMPELHWPLGYALAWLIFLVTAFGLFWFFKRKGWF